MPWDPTAAEKDERKLPVLARILSEQQPESPPEKPIDPQLPIVDPHHHLRDRPGHLYLLPELLRDVSRGHNLTATVVVECSAMYRAHGPHEFRPVGETEFVNGIAAMSASGAYGPIRVCAGIVGFADTRLGERVQEVIEAHITAGGGRFRGIRNQVTWDPDDRLKNFRGLNAPKVLLDPQVRRGVRCLAQYGLTLDVHLLFTQLGDLIDLAGNVPETTIVLDHIGGVAHIGPYEGRRDEVVATWKQRMRELSERPNVVVKIGGLGMETMGLKPIFGNARPSSEQLARVWRPYIETCVESFGPARCMFESNFPPDKKTCDYGVMWNAYKRVASQYTPAERANLFAATAARIYRLSDVSSPREGTK
jgi:predicted TIM-barrel fold metal-dependent hydrolase